jgi:hypothetical protein
METHPPLPVSRPTDTQNASQVSKNRAKALLMSRVIGEVAKDVKPYVFSRPREKKGARRTK